MSQTARTYKVVGMTCDHCRASVEEEVAEIPGVESVDVDLTTGRVGVRGDRVSDGAVAAAVEEAGYEVAEAR